MKKITVKKLIFLGYFLGIFIWRWIGSFSFSLSFWQAFFFQLFQWLLGAFIGAYFIKIDQLFYVYFTKPNDPLSLQIKDLIKQKSRKEAWRLLVDRVREQKLAFRSALFQAVWVVLAFFALTSTSGVFGKALVMAIGLHVLLDEWEDAINGRDLSWVFWQVKREVSGKEQRWFVGIISIFFLLLTLLLI